RARHGPGISPRAPDNGNGRRPDSGRRRAAGDRRRRTGAAGLSRRAGARMNASKESLVVDSVRAGYGDTVVLEGVSLALAAAGTLAILGRNGVGKTTLLATIMGQTTLRSGSIKLDGREVSALPTYRRVRL